MTTATCPSGEMLRAFSVGDVDDEQFSLVSDHLTFCDECDSRFVDFESDDESMIAMLRSLQAAPHAEEHEFAQVMQTLKTGPADDFGEPPERRALPEFSKSIDEYELLAVIGHGGMGVVHRARHRRLGHEVALKILPIHRHGDAASTLRFEREIAAVGKLHHPNIVKAYDAGEADDLHFLVMELIDGVNLHQLVKQQGPLQISDACEIVRQAALGLQHAHQHGLVHRDLKASNILLSRSGEVKVLDLGLALLQDEQHGEELTCAGQVMGTLDYMSPEQAADSHRVDHRTDLYSLGCTLFKLLTGHAPFGGIKYRAPAKKILAHAECDPPRLHDHRKHAPSELEELIGRLLEKDPERRPATAKELADMLEQPAEGHDLESLGRRIDTTAGDFDSAADDAEIAVMLKAKRPRRHSRTRVLLAALLLLVICAAGAIVIRFRDENGKQREVEVADGASADILHNGKVIARVNPPKADDRHSRALKELMQYEILTKEFMRAITAAPDATASSKPAQNLVDAHGDPIPRGAVARLGTTRFWMGGRYAAFSPDGKLLASANRSKEDKTIRLWDLATGKEVRRLEGHEAGVYRAVFSPDGKRLASVASDQTIRLWDVDRGAEIFRLRFEGTIRSNLAFSPDGKLLAAGTTNHTAFIWDVAQQREARRIEAHKREVRSVAFSPDGTLATGSHDDTIRFWNPATGEEQQRRLEAGHRNVFSIAYSPDGKLLASGGENDLKLWNLETGEVNVLWKKKELIAHSVAFSPDGKLVTSNGRVWNVKTLRLIRELSQSRNSVNSLVFSPDGKILAASNGRMWDVDTSDDPRDRLGFFRAGSLVRFTPDRKLVVTAGNPGTIRVWDAATGRHVRQLTSEHKYHKRLFVTRDGKRVIVGNEIFDIKTGRLLRVLTANEDARPTVMSLATDGWTAVSLEANGPARYWNIDTGKEIGVVNIDSSYYVYDIVFSGDFRLFAASLIDYSDQRKNVIAFFSRATGKRLHSGVVRGDTSLLVIVGERCCNNNVPDS